MNKKHLRNGVLGGLAGGVIFGMMMGMMGMLPMIGKLVGQPSVAIGFLVHMFNSAVIGAIFGIIFGNLISKINLGLIYGIIYGIIWWVLGPLTMMPLMMGMGVNWNMHAISNMMPSLMGHIIYGTILGITFAILNKRTSLIVQEQ